MDQQSNERHDSDERARVSGLASSICMLVGTMDLDELERLDAECRAIVDDRFSWARHAGTSHWCSVLRFEDGSVVTRCRGRWAIGDDWDEASRPPLAERCGACQEAFVASRVETVGRRRERIARSLSASAAVSPACGGRAHPSRDESASDAPAGSGARTSCCLLVPPCGLCPWRRTQAATDNADRDAPSAFVGGVDDLERELSEPTPIESGLAELANADFGLATGLLDDRGVDVQLEQIEDVDNDGDDFGGEAG